MTQHNFCVVAGARPNFMKIAPIIQELKTERIPFFLVHTGQHYDEKMSDIFFRDLGLPKPDINLEVGSGTHAQQTAKIMVEFEKVIENKHPDLVIVVGDVNSTIACALVAAKLDVKVAHVEAGLRSFNRSMPEEINRVLTDAISDYLFVTEKSGVKNLQREGISSEKIFLVGNVMIDTLAKNLSIAEIKSTILHDLKVEDTKYAIITLHRPYNVDEKESLEKLLNFIMKIQEEMPIIFPIHPRTRQHLIQFGMWDQIDKQKKLIICEPLGYLDFLKLMNHSAIVITDSGGIQEETSILGVPCLTLRPETERPVTVEQGTNILVGQDFNLAHSKFLQYKDIGKIAKRIELWDGFASKRIVEILKKIGNKP